MEVIYMKTNKTMVMNHTLWNVFQADEYNLKKRLILRKGLRYIKKIKRVILWSQGRKKCFKESDTIGILKDIE